MHFFFFLILIYQISILVLRTFKYQDNAEKYAFIPTIALLNGGGIRNGIDKGNITMRQLMSVCPFGNNLVVVALKGKEIKSMLEYGASKLSECGSGDAGRFLQVSGNLNI